jgi:UDP-MurNAc hydroxylase
MRFTVVGHASVFVESEGRRLIVDPWLFGSCYWRSWWHYPPIEEVDQAWLDPDYVYLTHHHFDHFHYPSLRRINKSATVFVPRFGVDFMAGELRGLGFTSIEEMDHGVTFPLAGSLEITSYQAGFDDSALIVKDNTAVLADFNDAKIRGRALDQIVRKHGSPTFLLKNHSWAQSYPHCYTSPDPKDLELINRDEKVAVFLQTVREAKPAFAIPFASNVCFLHPQTLQYNDTAITPLDVADAFAKDDTLDAELVIMGPGDHWSADRGFEISDWSDFLTNHDDHIERMAAAVEPQIAKSLSDAIDKNIVYLVSISMRVSVALSAGGVGVAT